MTCREKLKLEHPDCISHTYDGGCQGCPKTYGYLPEPSIEFCTTTSCKDCWDQEIPDLSETKTSMEGSVTITAPVIKDSGNRRQFDTGAVRDMQEGKGRCDLMPLEVAGAWLKDDVLNCIAQFKVHGTTTFLYGAMNYFLDASGWSYYDALLEVAKHFEEGAKKYGENNWQKGIPPKCYIDSAVRHYLKWLRGDKDEPHDRAFVWNLMCCIWEVDYRPKEKENV